MNDSETETKLSIPNNPAAAQGTWSGESRLHLHEEPAGTSPSQASVTLVASGKFLAVRCDWAFERAVRRA